MVTEKTNSSHDHLRSFVTENNAQFGVSYSFSIRGTCHHQGQKKLTPCASAPRPFPDQMDSSDPDKKGQELYN